MLQAVFPAWVAAFPDSNTEVTAVFAGEDFALVEYIGRSAHEGTLMSSAGGIPPTGRSVKMRFCDVHRIRDGKISRTRSYFDVAGMLVRLGLMPAPEERRVARRERV